MFVSGLLRCPVCFISVFFFSFSPWWGLYPEREEWMTHWFPKPLICPLDMCFSQCSAATGDALMMKPHRPCIISSIERSALSLRLVLNHQQYPKIYSCIWSARGHSLFFFFFKSLLRSVWIRHMFSVTQANTHSRISSTVNMLVNENHNFVTALTSQVCWPLPVGELCLYPIVNTK